MTGLTRDDARERVARELWESRPGRGAGTWDLVTGNPSSLYLTYTTRADADAALTVLWPVVESLRAELAHAHTVIARHVEPRREGES